MVGPPEPIDVQGSWGRLRVRRWGAPAAPLVLGVPGLTGTSENVAYLAERIAGPDLQMAAVDLRGRGYSEQTGAGTYGWANHARDLFTIANALGGARFSIVGQSMGGSVAMKAAEADAERLQAIVLIDVAGRVDPGVGPVIAQTLARLGRRYDSAEQCIAEVKASGLIDPWSRYWERAYRYALCDDAGGVRLRASPDAVAEDRSYTASQHPYQRWTHLSMPTLLVRATRELAPGSGHVVPVADAVRFLANVPQGEVVEIDGNHLTVNTHPDLPPATRRFLLSAIA